MKKSIIILISFCLILFISFLLFSKREEKTQQNQLTIDEILETENYSNLSANVKTFIKEYYEENSVVLLTKDLAEIGESYLNPDYIEYLDSDNKDEYSYIPSVTAYTPDLLGNNNNIVRGNTLPDKYDLRNVDGKNFVTPNKNQGSDGLCWAYASVSLLETHDLIAKDKSYDSDALILSEKQFDYASSSDGIIGGNNVIPTYHARRLTTNGTLKIVNSLLLERLGAFQSTWDLENQSVISNKGQLEAYKVFDRSKSLFEIGGTVELSGINADMTDLTYFEAMKDTIKKLIYNYGGAAISVAIDYSHQNLLSNYLGSDSLLITSKQYFSSINAGSHLMHVIGWDDDYEYAFCSVDIGGNNGKRITDSVSFNANHECDNYEYNGKTYTPTKVTGKGAWIVKNSWGPDIYPYFYLPYDSYISDLYAFTDYLDRDWDNSIKTKQTSTFINEKFYFKHTFDNGVIDGDNILKIKMRNYNQSGISLYFSEDGSEDNIVFIGTYSNDFVGYKTIDLSDKNLHLTKNSLILSSNQCDILLFTKSDSTNGKSFTEDYTYSVENANTSSNNNLQIKVNTYLNKISDGTTIDYKIKNLSGAYLPSDAYLIENNISYYDMVTPLITINEQYVNKGNYILEVWNNNKKIGTSLIKKTGGNNSASSTLSELLNDNGYFLQDNLVYGFYAGDTVKQVKDLLGDSIIVKSNNNDIATGTIISKDNEEYVIVIKGDITGDGKINSGDLLQMRKFLLEEVSLDGAYKQAGILESQDNIKSLDLLRLRQYLLGEYLF